uniref:Carn_acyltransf domain-containing protein n=1 Tax=Macrostomum lignano TaxID=282301 RepID=A0A1I8FK21_9PLAT
GTSTTPVAPPSSPASSGCHRPAERRRPSHLSSPAVRQRRHEALLDEPRRVHPAGPAAGVLPGTAREFCLPTNEASMTRCSRRPHGDRRSCTNESCAFVRAMEKRRLACPACSGKPSEKHQTMYRDAMTGKGVDRHLFTLYVGVQVLQDPVAFPGEGAALPVEAVTSQTPHGQTNVLDLEKHPDFLSAGGGFGPVSQDGYVASAATRRDSKRFGGTIVKALADLRTLLEEDVAAKEESKITLLTLRCKADPPPYCCTRSPLANLINFCVFCAEPVTTRTNLSALLRCLSLNDFTCWLVVFWPSLALVAITLRSIYDPVRITAGVEVGQEVERLLALSNNSGGESGAGSSSAMKSQNSASVPTGPVVGGYGTGRELRARTLDKLTTTVVCMAREEPESCCFCFDSLACSFVPGLLLIVTRMLIGFSLGYLVCSFPNYIALLFGHFVLGRYAPEKSMMQFNLVRSLIYAYCNRQFRAAFKRLFTVLRASSTRQREINGHRGHDINVTVELFSCTALQEYCQQNQLENSWDVIQEIEDK